VLDYQFCGCDVFVRSYNPRAPKIRPETLLFNG
jgi:hypothetical protein